MATLRIIVCLQVRKARRETELMQEEIEGRERRAAAKEARFAAVEAEAAEAHSRAAKCVLLVPPTTLLFETDNRDNEQQPSTMVHVFFSMNTCFLHLSECCAGL